MPTASQPVAQAQKAEYIVEVSDLVVAYGAVVAVDGVSFRIKAGEFLTLLGPSGCGKTTILRSIAGLERPTSGEIRVGGRVVYSSKEGIDIPAEHRNMSMVFQSYAIWPHLTAFENVVFGLRVRKRPQEEIERQGKWALDLVQMQQYAQRPASALSGGQQQRIALARAVAFSPDVILFDEPLSNLDANLRAQMRHEIKALQEALGVTSIYVTHDQEEALTMSDRIIVMSGGKIQQIASPDELYNLPANSFVANFIGSANLVAGRVDAASRAGELVDFVANDGSRIRAIDPRSSSAEHMLAVRAVYPTLSAKAAQAAAPNQWPCKVLRSTFSGDFVEYLVETKWGQIVVRRPPTERLAAGDEAVLTIDPQHCVVVDR
ncbi:MAG: ABC transporter ATP-binding protein [Variibacter sp.]